MRKGAGGVAVHIARERVQHQHLRQSPFRRGALGKQLTPRRCLQRVAEARANGLVQRGVFDQVLLGG